MRWILRLLGLVILVAVAVVGVLFSIQNNTPVPLDLLVVQLPAVDVSIWLIAALGLGVVLGMLAASLALLRPTAAGTGVRRQLTQCARKLAKVRHAVPKE